MTDKQQLPAAPERIFVPLDAARGWAKPEIREADDIPYARVHPVDDTRLEEIREQRDKVWRDRRQGKEVEPPSWEDVGHLLSLRSPNSPVVRKVHQMNKRGDTHKHVMTADDQDMAHELKNEFLDLCLKRKANALVALAAARCAAECFESIINEQGGEVFTDTAPTESSERHCGECGHQRIVDGEQSIDDLGRCTVRVTFPDDDAEECGCKCVFPSTEGEELIKRNV